MRKINRSKSIPEVIPPSESDAAYKQAQQLLEDRMEGYIHYDKIFISIEQVQTSFPRMTVGDILNFMGNKFYWKRPVGEPLVLYGKNEEKKELKKRGLVEIVRFRVPEAWIGVGRFRIAWPEKNKDDDKARFLIALYLSSSNISDFERLVAGKKANTAFMAALFLDHENSDLFNEQAEERFDSLR